MELNKYAIIEFLDNIDNFEEIFELVSIINSYDGSLSEIEFFYNEEEFFDIFFGINTIDAVRAVCYGDYKFEDEFVMFNAYENLESFNRYEVMNEYRLFKDEIADKIMELYDACDIYLDLHEEFYLN